MNSTTHVLSIDPHNSAAHASSTKGGVSVWAARLGWSVWYGLQAYGARRAMREMKLMGYGASHGFAPTANGKHTCA